MGDLREELFKNDIISKEMKEAVEKEKQGESSQKYKNYGCSGKKNNSKSIPRNKTVSEYSDTATAPYNFVSVPDKAVEAPLSKFIEDDENRGAGFNEYIKTQGNLCGEIEYKLINLTPVYIGDYCLFFAPNGKPIIPGSTMRGLVKNYLKIISCGTMRAENNEDITSRHLYFREFASVKSSLKDEYMERMMKDIIDVELKANKNENGMPQKKQESKVADVSAGFLVNEDDKWKIYPVSPDSWRTCRYEVEKDKNGEEKYILREYKNTITGKMEKHKKFFYINGFRDRAYKPHVNWCDAEVKVHSGKMENKGHFYIFEKPDWNEKTEDVEDMVIEEYKADGIKKKAIPGIYLLDKEYEKTRKIAGNRTFQHLVPCFYVKKEGKIESIGSTKFYRIPYKHSIEDHVPEDLRRNDKIDFADAIFGRKEEWAGRVWFEDARLKHNAGVLNASKPHNLMGPNPTSFQLYLEQKKQGLVKHWDDIDAKIRGYKMYWHKDIKDYGWKSGSGLNNKIQPLRKGSVFQGKVRFNNLSKEELGALLAVFELSKNGCFKIGMGKPIGMGSVECKYELNLFDSSKLYTKLFDGDGWNAAKEGTAVDSYIDAFDGYMKEQVKRLNIVDGYKKIMEDLSIMMSWENTEKTDWNKNLEYMPVGVMTDHRYRNRVPLPTPREVVNSEVKKK